MFIMALLSVSSTSAMSAPTTGSSSSAEFLKNLKVGNEEIWFSPMRTGFSSASTERKMTSAYAACFESSSKCGLTNLHGLHHFAPARHRGSSAAYTRTQVCV